MITAEPLQLHAGGHPRPPRRYWIYGLSVQSDVLLPGVPELPTAQTAPDVVLTRCGHEPGVLLDGEVVAQMACPVHGPYMREYREPDGAWIWLQAIGTFHVAPCAGRVDVYPDGCVDERTLSLALEGPILLFVGNRRGTPSLHASAVVSEHGAIAFLGPRGRGKSTMAATFLRRGAALLTDDALPLQAMSDGIYATPGPRFMKVWHETALHALDLDEELPRLMDHAEKKLFALDDRHRHARVPARLRAVYVLDRYDPVAAGRTDVTVRTLGARDALLTLMSHTSNRTYLLPADEAPFLPFYARVAGQVPVRVLTYPDGFTHQDAVHARIQADVEAQ